MIVIIDYGMGNLASVLKAALLYRKDTIISADPSEILNAERVILPGVGGFGDGMQSLNQSGIGAVLHQLAGRGTPILGICLGMQLLGSSSEESVGVEGLKLIDFKVERFDDSLDIKIPHVGWNNVTPENATHPLFQEVPVSSDFYFVHSYHVNPQIQESNILARSGYGNDFVCAVQQGSVYGVQFHPEKSQKPGLRLLQNFLTRDEFVRGGEPC